MNYSDELPNDIAMTIECGRHKMSIKKIKKDYYLQPGRYRSLLHKQVLAIKIFMLETRNVQD